MWPGAGELERGEQDAAVHVPPFEASGERPRKKANPKKNTMRQGSAGLDLERVGGKSFASTKALALRTDTRGILGGSENLNATAHPCEPEHVHGTTNNAQTAKPPNVSPPLPLQST